MQVAKLDYVRCSRGFVEPFSQNWKSTDVHKHTHPQQESGTHTLQGGRPHSSRQGLESYCAFILLKNGRHCVQLCGYMAKIYLSFLKFCTWLNYNIWIYNLCQTFVKIRIFIRKEWNDIGQLGKMRILKHSSEPPLPTDIELSPSYYFHIITKVRVQHDPGDHHKIKFKQIKTYKGRTYPCT